VYRAYQLSLRKHVAVKIIPAHLGRSPEEAARFHLEAEAAARHYLTVNVSRHTAYDSDQELIGILGRDQNVRELSEVADTATISELTGFVEKPYVCYPKPVDLNLSVGPDS